MLNNMSLSLALDLITYHDIYSYVSILTNHTSFGFIIYHSNKKSVNILIPIFLFITTYSNGMSSANHGDVYLMIIPGIMSARRTIYEQN